MSTVSSLSVRTAPARSTTEPAIEFVDLHTPNAATAAGELGAGLLAPAASIAPKFLYDALGLRLFWAITDVPEYTPTRHEAEIFRHQRRAISAAVGTQMTLIDLGAGDGAKAAAWFDAWQPRQYVAVDIAVDPLRAALAALQQRHPGIAMLGVGADFAEALQLPPQVRARQRLFFYPGSSIGNFTPLAACRFLQQARQAVFADGQLLIGVDLVKDRDALVRAYDDALGVTAAFNRNVLLHANRLLGADFDLADWEHFACFNESASRVEMHLQARREVTVRWRGGERRFARGERIHTENSYKYTPQRFAALLADAGWTPLDHWLDGTGGFAVFHATA